MVFVEQQIWKRWGLTRSCPRRNWGSFLFLPPLVASSGSTPQPLQCLANNYSRELILQGPQFRWSKLVVCSFSVCVASATFFVSYPWQLGFQYYADTRRGPASFNLPNVLGASTLWGLARKDLHWGQCFRSSRASWEWSHPCQWLPRNWPELLSSRPLNLFQTEILYEECYFDRCFRTRSTSGHWLCLVPGMILEELTFEESRPLAGRLIQKGQEEKCCHPLALMRSRSVHQSRACCFLWGYWNLSP